MEWFWCSYGFILNFSIFISIWFIPRLAAVTPCKGDPPHTFVDNKGETYGQAL